jgi:NADPH:quinone reductase-like Zn-dependent oxidoreductase
MQTMKAVQVHAYGASDVLVYGDAPRPVAAAGEVLIRVHATTVNPFDCAVHTGLMTGYFQYALPLIPGTDVSGVVDAVGEGVSVFRKGDEVYARAGVTRPGAYAEYVTAPTSDVALKPASLDHIHAAALPHVTLTAWQALFVAGDLKAGQSVLIHGAAGGVGHVAVQLAKLRGARVMGTASINIRFLQQLGVDQAINYEETRFESVVKDVDIVLDTIGGHTQERSWGLLRHGGILVSTVEPPSQETATAHGVRQAFVSTAPPIAETLTEVTALVEAGKLCPEVSHVLPLRQVQAAHGLLELHHTRGKIALQVVA